MREIILDVESTGLDVKKDRVIEIACVELFDKQPTGEILQMYINPQQTVSEEAIKIHGITNEMLADKPIFRECWNEIQNFIGNSIIVAHNAIFDISMINYELKLIGKKSINNEVVDTLTLAKKKFASNNSLDALAKRYKIKAERRLHGALKDCFILASIYYFLAITEIQVENLDLVAEDKPFFFPHRKNPSFVSEEEMKAHQQFLQEYGINI